MVEVAKSVQGRRRITRRDVEAEGLSFGPLENAIGFLLSIARLSVLEDTYAALDGETMHVGEFTVLMAIGRNPGIRQGVLADVLLIKWSNMTKVVRAFETRGLVERIVPDEDRRAIALRLTDSGASLVERMEPLFMMATERSVPMLDEAEQAQLSTLLRKVAGWPEHTVSRDGSTGQELGLGAAND